MLENRGVVMNRTSSALVIPLIYLLLQSRRLSW